MSVHWSQPPATRAPRPTIPNEWAPRTRPQSLLKPARKLTPRNCSGQFSVSGFAHIAPPLSTHTHTHTHAHTHAHTATRRPLSVPPARHLPRASNARCRARQISRRGGVQGPLRRSRDPRARRTRPERDLSSRRWAQARPLEPSVWERALSCGGPPATPPGRQAAWRRRWWRWCVSTRSACVLPGSHSLASVLGQGGG